MRSVWRGGYIHGTQIHLPPWQPPTQPVNPSIHQNRQTPRRGPHLQLQQIPLVLDGVHDDGGGGDLALQVRHAWLGVWWGSWGVRQAGGRGEVDPTRGRKDGRKEGMGEEEAQSLLRSTHHTHAHMHASAHPHQHQQATDTTLHDQEFVVVDVLRGDGPPHAREVAPAIGTWVRP